MLGTRFKKYNTLRNQILAIYLVVMMIVLSIVGSLMFNQLGALMRNNAEKQMQQTAVEANGRMETLYKQIDTLTNQVATNNTVQQLLTDVVDGKSVSVPQRESLIRVINNFHAYSNAISSFNLYTVNGERIYPSDNVNIFEKVDPVWIQKANREKGRLVWIGNDPNDREYSFAIRKVTLMERSFSGGGYLLVRINNSYFQVKDNSLDHKAKEYMMLLDRDYSAITSNYKGNTQQILKEDTKNVVINQTKYLIVKEKSDVTGWTLVILKPVSLLMEGVSVVRTSILISGAIGFIIFLISSIFLSTIITRPIIKLTNTMKNAKMDELKPNPHISSINEIVDLNNTYNQMVENTNHLIQQVYEKELLHSRAELKALQAQIDPHFLYNTLNALYWSLEDKGEEELANQVIAMSEFFRYTIGKTGKEKDPVTIREALEHIERYLQIMKMRMGDRLLWDVSVQEDCLDTKIPKLIIQPLVENAILHGIGNQRKQGAVSIKVKKVENSPNLVITVSDNGVGIDQETLCAINESIERGDVASSKGMGIGLANVNKRLSLFYEKQSLATLTVKSDQGKGTEVTFEIPSKGA
ncbi:sensor histidine kinase [Ectobacillus funiculus]|uniref:sensor histidine kinase n=1 Tax=Ectobacillus funiculus TaxID=137993 RepID=UPI00101D26AC|nr:sensor histidine kinase [Ectobacillus funiculus]